jgi:hypothetical protein
MQGQDHTEITSEHQEPAEQSADEIQESQQSASTSTPTPGVLAEEPGFDWLAIGVVIIIAALFALLARLNPQPSTSIAPAAVLSATGCGLLVTAIRKLRTSQHPGLFEAALAGVFLALFQFIAAISYPNVINSLSLAGDQASGFFTTWGLIAVFSLLFSIIGATLGHLAFAPLRPSPASKKKASFQASSAREVEENDTKVQPSPLPGTASRQRIFAGYFISVVLLGLAPTVAGYIFSAAFDYMLSINHFFPGPYPTLRLLSALLPWQVPISINLGAPNLMFFFLWQLWRFPVLLGNPTVFDIQALEPFIFNGAALALLLLTLRNQKPANPDRSPQVHWPMYLSLEILLGLLLVLPADLWIVRGLQGLLQNPVVAIPIRTLNILNPLTFTLNLITGPLVCLALGVILRLLSTRREKEPEKHE